jgi:hypothetical protein
LRLGVFLNRRCADFDLEKSISLLVRSVSRLNWDLPGVDLVGVFLGSKEATVSDSFSDPEGDGDRALGATWLLPGKKRGSIPPFFLREGAATPRPLSTGVFFSAPDLPWDDFPKRRWLLVRTSSMVTEGLGCVSFDGGIVVRFT